MKISKDGIKLICKFEGCKLIGYLCPARKLTIGYGHTGLVDGKPIKIGMKITKAKAIELLQKDLARFEECISKWDHKYHWTQNEFDALVSFAYNGGEESINKLTADGTRTKEVIGQKILCYNKARVNGELVPLLGLTRRRKAEQKRYLSK